MSSSREERARQASRLMRRAILEQRQFERAKYGQSPCCKWYDKKPVKGCDKCSGTAEAQRAIEWLSSMS